MINLLKLLKILSMFVASLVLAHCGHRSHVVPSNTACFDFMVNVDVSRFAPVNARGVHVDLNELFQYEVSQVVPELKDKTVQMQITLKAQKANSQEDPITVTGQSEVQNFKFKNQSAQANNPIDWEGENSLEDLVRIAVREGLENLKAVLREDVQSWRSIVHTISPEEHLIIPGGTSDQLEEGDMFNVYAQQHPKEADDISGENTTSDDKNENESDKNTEDPEFETNRFCNDLKLLKDQEKIATAKIIGINEHTSRLELIPILEDQEDTEQIEDSTQIESSLQIQTGDIVELDRELALNDHVRIVLWLQNTNKFVSFKFEQRSYRENISSHIRKRLQAEAEAYGFETLP